MSSRAKIFGSHRGESGRLCSWSPLAWYPQNTERRLWSCRQCQHSRVLSRDQEDNRPLSPRCDPKYHWTWRHLFDSRSDLYVCFNRFVGTHHFWTILICLCLWLSVSQFRDKIPHFRDSVAQFRDKKFMAGFCLTISGQSPTISGQSLNFMGQTVPVKTTYNT